MRPEDALAHGMRKPIDPQVRCSNCRRSDGAGFDIDAALDISAPRCVMRVGLASSSWVGDRCNDVVLAGYVRVRLPSKAILGWRQASCWSSGVVANGPEKIPQLELLLTSTLRKLAHNPGRLARDDREARHYHM